MIHRLLLASLLLGAASEPQQAEKPNIVVIFADDLGYGDLGCYGHPTIRTPNLDRMAAEGMRFTDFYVAAPVCTPSRAALLTGRYAVRSGMASEKRRVLFPNSGGGLPDGEITIAEGLKTKGYATAMVGKWHLGHLPQFLPTKQGFDSWFGLPYSNDMDPAPAKPGEPKWMRNNVPLMRNEEVVERPADQTTLTRRYTEEAVKIIKANKDKPFFLYLAHAMPHIPLFAGEAFAGKSPRGLYGDVVEELDWSVGQVLQALRAEGIEKRTLVVFTSDNGPWLIKNENGGSAGLLQEGKGSTWEGGLREPGIFWWPGKIAAGVVARDIACSMDLFTTALKLGGAEVPADRPIDGLDLSPLLFGTGPSPRQSLAYYRDTEVWAFRKGHWKIHVMTRSAFGKDGTVKHDPPLLFDLHVDPSERFDVAKAHPQVVTDLLKALAEHEAGVKLAENQLEKDLPK
ncbi:MAG TPA: sulfatase [Planctomycetota bacterium]|nr:sulfatase [Planctomycetota bacterium]